MIMLILRKFSATPCVKELDATELPKNCLDKKDNILKRRVSVML